MTINIFVLKGDLNGENRSGAVFFVGYNFKCKIVNMFCSPVLSFSLVLKRTVSLRCYFEYLKPVFKNWYKY